VFPLWLAGLTERVLYLFIPLLVVVFPLGRALPGIYRYVVERRIYGLYGQLKVLESELDAAVPGQAPPRLAAALDDLARRANSLSVPILYAQRLFILKSHIALTKEKFEKRGRGDPSKG